MLIFKTFKAQILTSCSERQAHFSFKWGRFSSIRGSALLCGTTFRRSTNQQPKTNKQTTNQRTDPQKAADSVRWANGERTECGRYKYKDKYKDKYKNKYKYKNKNRKTHCRAEPLSP